jgi:DNA-binding protein H-NS
MPRALSLKDIERRIRQLRAEAERLERAEKPGIKQLRAVLKKFRLGPPDIRIALREHGSRVSKLKGRKVKPKYRNPSDRSETWTGRGRTPLWMAALVKRGKKPADFLIKGA